MALAAIDGVTPSGDRNMQHWDIYRRALDYWSTLQMRVITRILLTVTVIIIVLAARGF